MIQTYAVIKDNTIIRVYETGDGEKGATQAMENESIDGDLALVPTPFEGIQGQVRREFTEGWKLRPIADRVADGIVILPGDVAIDQSTGEVRKKTLKEQVADGTIKLETWQEYDAETDAIVTMSWAKRMAAGTATREKWLDAIVRPYRNTLLYDADTIYCNPERWWGYSDTQKSVWSAYKQALRDFPDTKLEIVDDPEALVWPTIPEES